MMFDPNIAYDDLPLLPPSFEIDSKKILKKCIKARAQLAQLNGLANLLPNQEILINSIPLMEAKNSSEIENIVTTTDAIYQSAIATDTKQDSATKEVLHYRQALKLGSEALSKKPISTNLIIDIVSCLLNKEMTIRKIPGTTLSNPATSEVIYTPPAGKEIINKKLSNWEQYIHQKDDIDPLIKLAISHYQFEAIHPFLDGNGRTGRIVNILFLVEKKLLELPVLYLSRYIAQNKDQYYKLLINVTTHNQWEPWILFMLDAVEVTSLYTKNKIENIHRLLLSTISFCQENLPSKVYSKELIELLFYLPYCRIKTLVDHNIAARHKASNDLKALAEIGVLESKKVGKETLYINTALLSELSN